MIVKGEVMNENCNHCGAEITSNYCPDCGQTTTIKRIDGYYIIQEIKDVLLFERGIFYTISALITAPGHHIRQYITVDRKRLVKPINFIIITSLFYSLINHYFQIEDSYINYSEVDETAISAVFQWIQGYYGYANIIMGGFVALWIKLFFRKYDFNFFEILILLCYVMGMGMLILGTIALVQALTGFKLMQVASAIMLVYSIWAIGQFFDKNKISSYLKVFPAYILGFLCFSIVAVALGLLIDVFVG